MAMPASTLGPEFGGLTPEERLELIAQLWDSLSDLEHELPIPDWHREELDRRLAAADAAPEAAIPWEQVRERLRQRP
jgi:putative addiction module component (TIGR02574 family)